MATLAAILNPTDTLNSHLQGSTPVGSPSPALIRSPRWKAGKIFEIMRPSSLVSSVHRGGRVWRLGRLGLQAHGNFDEMSLHQDSASYHLAFSPMTPTSSWAPTKADPRRATPASLRSPRMALILRKPHSGVSRSGVVLSS